MVVDRAQIHLPFLEFTLNSLYLRFFKTGFDQPLYFVVDDEVKGVIKLSNKFDDLIIVTYSRYSIKEVGGE